MRGTNNTMFDADFEPDDDVSDTSFNCDTDTEFKITIFFHISFCSEFCFYSKIDFSFKIKTFICACHVQWMSYRLD